MIAKDQLGKTLAGWQLRSLLGQGGMGAVFHARHTASGREGAFKLVITPSSTSQAAARLKRETELLSRLSHPGLVRVLTSGVLPDGRPYYVMDLVPGQALDALVDEEAPLEPRRAAALMAKAAHALGHAHAQAIVHRDLKPSNIIVRPDGSPVVLDFGLAKAVLEDEAERLSKTGQLLGTVHYMSPEQALGSTTRDIGPASDVFSLGVVLYELLTGERPFAGATAVEVLARIGSAITTPARELIPGLPRALDAIVSQALARDPALRYADAEALALDLDRFLEGKRVLARPPRGLGRGARRVLAGAVTLAFLATLAVLGVALSKTVAPLTSVNLGDVHGLAVSLNARAKELAANAHLSEKGAGPLTARAAPVAELVSASATRVAALPPGEPARVELIHALAQARAALLAIEPRTDAVIAGVEAAERELEGTPEPPLLAAVRGIALEGRGHAPDAIAAFERALAAAGAERECVVDLFPPPRLEDALASELLAAGRAADSAAVLDKVFARAHDGEHSAASGHRHLLRARARQQLRQFELAVADVEAAEVALKATDSAAARDPWFAASFVQAGKALLDAGGHDEVAAHDFVQAYERDPTVFTPDLAPRAAAVMDTVAAEEIRHMAQAASTSEIATGERIRAQHRILDFALALDPTRDKAPPALIFLEEILCRRIEQLQGVRFVVAERFRRLKIPFDMKEDLYMMRAADGQWGLHEKALREKLALVGDDRKMASDAYGEFCHATRARVPEATFEAEAEWLPIVPPELKHFWCRERAMTLLALHRSEEGWRLLDESVRRAQQVGRDAYKEELFWRGSMCKDAGRWKDAVADLRLATSMHDEDGLATNGYPWLDLAISLHELHQDREALTAVARAREHGGPDETTALGPLEAAIQEALGKGR